MGLHALSNEDQLRALLHKLEFHGTDTDTDILADFPIQLATSRTRTTILADMSTDFSDTRAFPREDVR